MHPGRTDRQTDKSTEEVENVCRRRRRRRRRVLGVLLPHSCALSE